MKTRVIVMLFIALFTFAGAGSSKAGEIKKVKTSSSKIAVIPGPDKARVFEQGRRHRWHRMHSRRHRHEPVRRHHMRRMHHRESRHYRR